nr:uncharacterized protein LOC129156189 [Nothobranchius furzeri]
MVSSRFLNESTARNFSAAFDPPCSSDNDPDSLTSQFNEHCLSILDNICPVRTRSVPAVNPTPWFNDSLRSLKHQCRKIERLWKKTHLHVHLLHLKDLLTSFNSAVRDARISYFSNLVSQSKGNPKVLFKTISSIVSPASPIASIYSVADCENFLSFFVDKVNKVRSSISPSALSLPLPTPARPVILDSFAHVSLPELTKLVNSMKTSACPLDILPSSLFKSAFLSIGPSSPISALKAENFQTPLDNWMQRVASPLTPHSSHGPVISLDLAMKWLHVHNLPVPVFVLYDCSWKG